MSLLHIENYGCVSNGVVYGLYESVARGKYPLAAYLGGITAEITDATIKLAQCEKGTGHDQFLTGIVVQFDLSFSNKAWVEFQRYHFVDFISSQSTMHRITRFDLNTSYNKYVDRHIVEIMKAKVSKYNELSSSGNATPDQLNKMYLEILYSNPSGFILTAGITTNYRQLKTIYAQRKNHRLPEWREFCRWIETLPHSEFITRDNKNEMKEV